MGLAITPAVELAAARYFFERAAEMEPWLGKFYLGKMCLNGIGVPRALGFAFKLFQEAAQASDPVALRALARCYRRGTGTARNARVAEYLEALAARYERRNPLALDRTRDVA